MCAAALPRGSSMTEGARLSGPKTRSFLFWTILPRTIISSKQRVKRHNINLRTKTDTLIWIIQRNMDTESAAKAIAALSMSIPILWKETALDTVLQADNCGDHILRKNGTRSRFTIKGQCELFGPCTNNSCLKDLKYSVPEHQNNHTQKQPHEW